MDKKWIIAILVVVLTSVFVTAAPWVYTFSKTPFSTNPANWGVFGDYFGGVLSTIISIFGFIAVLMTIRIQSAGITAQLAGLKQDKETRDDEIYNTQALQCLEEALLKLNDPTNGRVYRDRTAWLESARLILTARELSNRITSESMRTVYAASEKLIRSKFQTRLDPKRNQDTIQPEFFVSTQMEAFLGNRTSDVLEKHSVYVIYRFASWPTDEKDLIDTVEIEAEAIDCRYFGARIFLGAMG